MKRIASKSTPRKAKSIMDKVQPVENRGLSVTALFYGRSGTGKTTLAGSFPKPLLVLDIGERGTDSLANVEGVDYLSITEWSEIEEVYWELKESDHKYKSVCIDALHSMQSLAIKEAKIQAKKKVDEPTSQKDFGQAGGLMTTWASSFRDLAEDGMHVVFLAHDRVQEVSTEDDAEVILPEVGPRLMPSVASAILGAVNVVGNTYIRELVSRSKKVGEKPQRQVQYCLRIGPHGYYATKVRRPKDFPLPEFIVDPTYGKLVNVIQGKKADSPKPRRSIRRSK